MSEPDVTITVAGGAPVDVFTPGVVVEVRDYDVDGVDEELLSTDENKDQRVRYCASHADEGAAK